MEEAPENGKESSHSARANGMHEMNVYFTYSTQLFHHIHCIQQVLRYGILNTSNPSAQYKQHVFQCLL